MYEKLLFTVIVISCLSGGTNSITNYIQKIPNDLYIFNYFLQLSGFRFPYINKINTDFIVRHLWRQYYWILHILYLHYSLA